MYIVLGILIILILTLTPFLHSYAIKIGFVDKNILNLSKQKIPIIGGPTSMGYGFGEKGLTTYCSPR